MYWNPSPVLLEIGPLSIRWYGLLFAGGFLVSYFLLARVFVRDNLSRAPLEPLFWTIFWGTLLGARLGHILFYEPAYYFSHPLEILAVWHGGLASHGGAIGIVIGFLIFFRKNPHLDRWAVLDRLAIIVPVAAGFIRLGNLMNSEIIGRPSDLPWAFVFARVDLLPRHPAQLYEALAYFCIGGVLYFLHNHFPRRNGLNFGAMLALIFGFRFFVEFLKEDQTYFEAALPINMGQILSIPFIIAGLGLAAWAYLRSSKSKAA